jgi:diguanylate cyclase (GGDEF)-like protein
LNRKRSAEEIIVIGICAICLSGLVPFIFVRLSQGDVIVAVIDLVGAMTAVACIGQVLKARSTRYVAPIIATLMLIGMTTNILILGSNDLFFLYPVIIATFFLIPPFVALMLSLSTIAVVVYFIYPLLPLLSMIKILFSLLATAAFTYTFAWQRNRQKNELLVLSQVDQLTGAGNRRALREQLEALVQSHQRDQQPMSLIILDIDNFKTVNDQAGHASGDEVLVKLTKLIESRIRVTDYLYRYGGDEFMILANHSNLDTTRILAEDIRNLAYQGNLVDQGRISVSIGVSEYQANETPDEWLIRADNAMYVAKGSGKNAVSISEGSHVLVGEDK